MKWKDYEEYGGQAPRKKPFYKRAWFIILVFLFVVLPIVTALATDSDDQTADKKSGDQKVTEQKQEEQAEPEEKAEPAEPDISMEEKNALRKAEDYLAIIPFSYDGLVNQLKFDQFTEEAAIYAADHCGADWKEQAVKKAKSYLDLMAFSHDGLVDQLLFDGFTQEQAEYGVSQNGL